MRAFAVTAILALAVAAPALAADTRGLKIGHPWTRPAAEGGTAAGYLTIANAGSAPDTLLSVESSAARTASLHRSGMNGAVMQMRPLSAGLAVPAKGEVALAPGGDHIMLSGLKKALSQGQKIPVTLVFQRAGRIAVELTVETSAPPTPTVAKRDHH